LSKKFGCLVADRSVPRARLRRLPGATLNPPASVDWYSQVPAASWGMLANGPDNSIAPGFEGCGDCTIASAGHIIDQVAWYAQNDTPAPVTSAETLALYEAMTGYDPSTGANDTGATLEQALTIWQQNGLAGYKPTGWAEIDHTDIQLVQTCIAAFGAVYAALEVPASAMQQFDRNMPWTPVPRSPIEGGHAVPLVGYDSSFLYAVTWGAVQKISYSFYTKYFEEAVAVALPQLIEASGHTPSGLDTGTANSDWQAITGSSTNPFPTVGPPPPPAPAPTPGSANALLAEIQDDLVQAAAAMTVGATETTALANKIAAFLASQGGGDAPPHVHGH
jgi:hypothetical protein